MSTKCVFRTKKEFDQWIEAGNIFARSLCPPEEVRKQFNRLSVTQRVEIKHKILECDKRRREQITDPDVDKEGICLMVDLHIIACEYGIDPLTVILCFKPICRANEKIILKA